jgi:hypothetical protein
MFDLIFEMIFSSGLARTAHKWGWLLGSHHDVGHQTMSCGSSFSWNKKELYTPMIIKPIIIK